MGQGTSVKIRSLSLGGELGTEAEVYRAHQPWGAPQILCKRDTWEFLLVCLALSLKNVCKCTTKLCHSNIFLNIFFRNVFKCFVPSFYWTFARCYSDPKVLGWGVAEKFLLLLAGWPWYEGYWERLYSAFNRTIFPTCLVKLPSQTALLRCWLA